MSIGYATLDIIPSLRGLQSNIDQQARVPLAASGKAGGRLYGDAAGREAGSSFVTLFQQSTSTAAMTTAGRSGGRVFGQGAGREAGANFVSLFQREVRDPIISAGQSGGFDYGAAAGESASESFAERFQGGLESSELIAGAGLADVFQDAIADTGEAGQEAGEEFAEGAADGLGKLQGLLATVGGVGILADLIEQGSSAEQAVGGVRAVFGEFADEIEAESARAAQALGLSSTAYQELVTISGALLKNKGLEDYADQAEKLIATGADLAAQFGGSTADAVGALNAALRGESDPIERYAISLNETAVNARLAAQGQASLTGAALDQAKITARLAIIQDQSADAMGAFGREANTQAGQAARAQAALADLRAELGGELLPAATAVTGAINRDVIPALGGLADTAVAGVGAFIDLPQPIRDAALAFIALRVASAVGITPAVIATGRTLALTYGALYIRLFQLRAAYQANAAASGRMQATWIGLRAGASATAVALRSVAIAAAPIAAITAAVTIFGRFQQAQQESKERVDALTASLDKQTGAIGQDTASVIAGILQSSDGNVQPAADAAKELGISLETLTRAALEDADAMAEVNRVIAEHGEDSLSTRFASERLNEVLSQQGSELDRARTKWADQKAITDAAAEATAEMAANTVDATSQTRSYAEQIDDAQQALKKLILREKERHDALLSTRQDALALEEQITRAREQSREGENDGINARTKKGQENRGALYDLIDQFNNAEPAVRNAEGNFERVRNQLLLFADEMGVGEKQATRLIDELLRVPKTAPLEFQTRNFRRTMRELDDIERAAKRAAAALALGQEIRAGRALPEIEPGASSSANRRAHRPAPVVPAEPPPGLDFDPSRGGLVSGRGRPGGTSYNFYGDVTYTDDEQGRRRAQKESQRTAGDGVRRG